MLPATHAVMKHAMFPFIIDRKDSWANCGRLSGADDARLPRFIPRAAILPNPQRMYVANTADRFWKRL
jgi:hypothetical protein